LEIINANMCAKNCVCALNKVSKICQDKRKALTGHREREREQERARDKFVVKTITTVDNKQS